MLRRARAAADRRGIHWIEFVEADVEALPFEDRSFELVVTYTGLHCFPDPPAAIVEMARLLRPGGELRGTSVIKRTGAAPGRVRAPDAGWWGVRPRSDPRRARDLFAGAAGLVKVSTSRNGALAYFSARRRGGSRSRRRSV